MVVDCGHHKAVNTSCLKKQLAFARSEYKNCKIDDCKESFERGWVCLQCGHIGCGDENGKGGHAQIHYETPHSDSHALITDGEHLWCWLCESREMELRPNVGQAISIVKKFRVPPKVSNEPSPIIIAYPPPPPPQPQEVEVKVYVEEQEFIPREPKTLGVPVGLENLGNTCYMNAALQCLARTEGLLEKLQLITSENTMRVRLLSNDESLLLNIIEEDDKTEEPVVNGEMNEITDEPIETDEDNSGPVVLNVNFGSHPASSALFVTLKAISAGGPGVHRPSAVRMLMDKHFTLGAQHDSHEFIRCLLDTIKKEQIKSFRLAILNHHGLKRKEAATAPPAIAEQSKAWDRRLAHRTFVDEVFGGELVITQTCLTCKAEKKSHENFLDLSLPIRTRREKGDNNPEWGESEFVINKSVEDCLSAFVRPETLDGPDMVECDKCNAPNNNNPIDSNEEENSDEEADVRSVSGSDEGFSESVESDKKETIRCPCTRQQLISKLPNNLQVHLKRFGMSGRGTSKISNHVAFPPFLDMANYCEPSALVADGSARYGLFALVEHSGSMHFGHYVAHVKTEKGWFYASDSHCRSKTETEVLASNPYVLFYRRLDQIN